MSDQTDRELGMNRRITRRDFLNGMAVTAGAAMMPWQLFGGDFNPEKSPSYYPPALTGMRGSHPGSFDAAHALRDGTFWDTAGTPQDTGESFDLIVVGGGISGLAAAHFYRKNAGANARILILDNHDDFGGHAKRNEFRVSDAFRLGFGGTYSIESPAPYSQVARAVIEELGIDVASYPKYHDANLYHSFGLGSKIFFDKETFGVDRLVVSPATFSGGEKDYIDSNEHSAWKQMLAQAPIAPQAKADFERLLRDQVDYFPGLTSTEKKAKLARISYANFLREVVKAHEDVVKVFQAVPQPLFGLGIDAVAAQDDDLIVARGIGLAVNEHTGADYREGMQNRAGVVFLSGATNHSRNKEDPANVFHFPCSSNQDQRLMSSAFYAWEAPITASASISISISGEISALTWIIDVAGRMSRKNSPCALPIFSQSAMLITYMRVRTTSFNVAPAFFKADSMFFRTCTVWA